MPSPLENKDQSPQPWSSRRNTSILEENQLLINGQVDLLISGHYFSVWNLMPHYNNVMLFKRGL